MRLQRQNSGLGQSREVFRDRGEKTVQVYGSHDEFNQQGSEVRQLKEKQELNEELQMKADELEKLFAAHQLRVLSNQLVSSRRLISPVDAQEEEVSVVQQPEKGIVGNMIELDPNKNLVELGLLNNCRGKFYGLYTQKRDAKLRKEWDSKRVENEEKMKVMSDRLERARDEMKAYFASSSTQQELTLHSRRRAEKFKSFDKHIVDKITEQKPIEPIQIQDDYVSDSSKHCENGSTRSSKPKKFSHSRTFSSSNIPRSTAPPIPRSASKGSNVGRRRIVPENPVGQSLPNFSEFKEEYTKQSQGIRKEANRLQFSHIPHSVSTNGKVPSAKKDNVWRSQSMKKSSASPNESKNALTPNSSGVNLATSQKNGESKTFLKKGNGIGPGAGASAAKLRATKESENMHNAEESVTMVDKQENIVGMVTKTSEETIEIKSIPTDSDINSSRQSKASAKSGIPGLEDIVILKSNSQVEPDLVSEVIMVPSTLYTPARPAQDSPTQNPASWSSHINSPVTYSRKRLDINVVVDSPMATSPASWHAQSLASLETNSPQTRKKWGVTQKPILIANASENQSHNLTKGIKRLLNFGRKTRVTEGLTDCISSTTSEGDDDTDDDRDLASRSSDDYRKSRMGISQDHCSYEAFNDEGKYVSKVQNLRSSIPASPENFKLKGHHHSGSLLTAPRSLFSLSSFRSKGSELKPR